MPTFVITASWTDQGVRAIKDVPKRTKAARELARSVRIARGGFSADLLHVPAQDRLLLGDLGRAIVSAVRSRRIAQRRAPGRARQRYWK